MGFVNAPTELDRDDVTALVAEKNELVRENHRLVDENAMLRGKLITAAERIAGQSELLSKRAERNYDGGT